MEHKVYIFNPETGEVLHKLKTGGYSWMDSLYNTYTLSFKGYSILASTPITYKSHKWAMKLAHKFEPNWNCHEVRDISTLWGIYDSCGKLVK